MPRPRVLRSEGWILLSGLVVTAAGAVLAAPPAAHASAPPTAKPLATAVSLHAIPSETITLQPGATLWGLSQQYGVPIPVLQAANGLGTSTLIYAGQPFVIPGRVSVSAGTSLGVIASVVGVSVEQLMALNGLSSTTIDTGAVLYLPGSAGASTATAVSSVLSDLAHLVQSEAGNQPFLGQVAVAAVVLNRVRAPGFPKTVAGVIFQPGQFESVSNGTYYMAPDSEAYQAAEAALNGEDPTGGALYYYNPSLTSNPWMKDLPVLVTIGSQVFCR